LLDRPIGKRRSMDAAWTSERSISAVSISNVHVRAREMARALNIAMESFPAISRVLSRRPFTRFPESRFRGLLLLRMRSLKPPLFLCAPSPGESRQFRQPRGLRRREKTHAHTRTQSYTHAAKLPYVRISMVLRAIVALSAF